MKCSLKIDWLSFTFKGSEDMKEKYSDCFDAFLDAFPHVKDILDECCLIVSGRAGKYYDNVLGWNDGICISYDNNDTTQFNKKVDSWGHGVNVCIPSHGLGNLYKLLGIECVSCGEDPDFFENYRNIYSILKGKNCKISRLDIAMDDFTKTFMPIDFLHYMENDCLCSPCKAFSFVKNSRGNGQTFYMGARSNKFLRVYNKAAESHGEIDSVRYEIELHNRYANDVSDMILTDNFDFFKYFEKYFFTVKKQDENKKHVDKRNASRLENADEWEDFKKNLCLTNKEKITFPKITKDVSITKKAAWIEETVAPSMADCIEAKGIGWLFEVLENQKIDDYDLKIIKDYWRNYNIKQSEIDYNVEKLKKVKHALKYV